MNAASSEPVISFEDVHLGFGEGDILRGISFHVLERETKVLVGETGTGKTLILKLAAGCSNQSPVRCASSDAISVPMTEAELLLFRREIGFVFQEGALFDSMSVADNVAYRLNEEGVDARETDARVREALGFVEMEDAIDKLPGELSGGMKRRVAIARAVVSRPPIVLYDSPTAGLDPITLKRSSLSSCVLRDTLGVTALLATHRLQDAFALANYRFDPAQNRVTKLSPAALASRNGQPPPISWFYARAKFTSRADSKPCSNRPTPT